MYQKDPSIDVQHNIESYEDEPLIIKEEVLWNIKHIANGKSPGTDDIPIEQIKNSGEEIINKILKLCNLVWKLKEWPEDWKRTIYIPLPKKGDSRDCANNRTIALISHVSKIILK